jgi:predicted DNA-binding mobile mystery protein A
LYTCRLKIALSEIKQSKDVINPSFREIILDGLEQRLPPLSAAREPAKVPARGWLRAVREALGLTQGKVAEKAAMKRQSYAQFENAEKKGTISLASLRRAAAAMDCEVVYFIVPRESVAPSYRELAGLLDPASRHLKATDQSMALGIAPGGDHGS